MNTFSSDSNDSFEAADKIKRSERFKVTRRLSTGAIVALVAWIFLIIAFASPYWLSSYKYTYSEFVRLGLWDFCFRDYRHPSYQYDQKFSGCYWVYSGVYHNIRDWLQPDWFIFVQAMIVLAFIYSTVSLIILATLIMYYLTRYQVVLMISVCILQIATAVSIFVGTLVFGLQAFDRSWLLYPRFNHLDWAYYVAILSMIVHIVSLSFLTLETQQIRLQRRKLQDLSFQLQPRPIETYDATNPEEQNPIMVQQPEVHYLPSNEPTQTDGVSILQQFHKQQHRNSSNYPSSQPHFTQV